MHSSNQSRLVEPRELERLQRQQPAFVTYLYTHTQPFYAPPLGQHRLSQFDYTRRGRSSYTVTRSQTLDTAILAGVNERAHEPRHSTACIIIGIKSIAGLYKGVNPVHNEVRRFPSLYFSLPTHFTRFPFFCTFLFLSFLPFSRLFPSFPAAAKRLP